MLTSKDLNLKMLIYYWYDTWQLISTRGVVCVFMGGCSIVLDGGKFQKNPVKGDGNVFFKCH